MNGKQEKKNLIQIPLFKWGKSILPVQAFFYTTQNFDISMNIIVEIKQRVNYATYYFEVHFKLRIWLRIKYFWSLYPEIL